MDTLINVFMLVLLVFAIGLGGVGVRMWKDSRRLKAIEEVKAEMGTRSKEVEDAERTGMVRSGDNKTVRAG